VKRIVFALKKIKEFNHHYFNDQELRILNPLNLGIYSYFIKGCYVVGASALTIYLWNNWSFNFRSCALLGAVVGVGMVANHFSAVANETFI
jgi:hypothetical protein